MRVIYFNVGESQTDVSPLAKYAKGAIDNKEFRDFISAWEMGFGGGFDKDGPIAIKGNDVEYRGQFLCYAKDLFTKHLTQKGRKQVIDSATTLASYLKSEDESDIFVYLPNQMNHEEVVSILYTLMMQNGQELNPDNIIHDDRLVGFEDYRRGGGFKTSAKASKNLREDYEKDVLGFVQDLTSPKSKAEEDSLVIIVGGDELYETMTSNKKIQKYCSVFEGSNKQKLQQGETCGLLISAPQSVVGRILG